MKKQRIWEINRPDDSVRYNLFHFRNGRMEPKYGIPSVKCPKCDVWYEYSCFPFDCPEKFRSHPNIFKSGPIPLLQFQELILEMDKEFAAEGLVCDENLMDRRLWMQPGTDFQPWEFRIPCHPRYSFLWAGVPLACVVAQEVVDVFEEHEVTGVTFHPVEILYVGQCAEENPPGVDLSKYWDMNDYYEGPPYKIPPEENPESFGPLYYMRVSHIGPDWCDWDNLKRCALCGKYDEPPRPEYLPFSSRYLIDYDIFRSEVVSGILINEKVYDILHSYPFTNIPLFEEIMISDEIT